MGLLSLAGDLILPIEYDYISDFSDGLCLVTKSGKATYIDKSGEQRLEPIFDYIYGTYDKYVVVSFDENDNI